MTDFYHLNVQHLENALQEENLRFEKDKKIRYLKYFVYVSGKERKTCNIDTGGIRDGWIFLFFDEAFTLANQRIIDSFEPITEEEARIKHYGRARAVYKGHDYIVIKELVKAMKRWLGLET